MMEIILQVFQASGYLLLLAVLVVLWITSLRFPDLRGFWTLLALAWTLNLLGNVAWYVHDLTTGRPLDSISYVDAFYLARYVLVALAFREFPAAHRRWTPVLVGSVMLVTGLVVWAVYYRPVMAITAGDWSDFLGYAMYPVMDSGLIVFAGLRCRDGRQTPWIGCLLLLFGTMLSYGLANQINMNLGVFHDVQENIASNLLWPLADVFALIAVLRFWKTKAPDAART